VLDQGWAVALERYFPEQRTEAQARQYIQANLVDTIREWARGQPEVVRHTLVVWGFFLSAPPEFLDVDPGVDYKAFMDLQFGALANDPNLFGLYGVTTYLSAYSDEETIRWAGRLYRHYCLEGQTERLTDTYNLSHIHNPDFEQGLQQWTARPAVEGSISTGTAPGLSWLEGRYPPTNQGNTYLLLTRSDRGPNTIAQTVKGLQPGRLYSLKMITGDRQDFVKGVSAKQTHAVSLDLGGVEPVPDKCFQFAFPSCYAHVQGSFNAQTPYWMNLHHRVFRAKAQEATLTISDWAAPNQPGGPIGQELMLNFVQVQPYFED
jgi:hypothetical protein